MSPINPDTSSPPFTLSPSGTPQSSFSSPPSIQAMSSTIDALRSDVLPPASPTPSVSLELVAIRSPTGSSSEPLELESATMASVSSLMEVDPQILEALKSKDRLYVLKLGEQMESLINDHRTRLDLTPATSYQRLLVHRCSAYYKLTPEPDPISKTITVVLAADSRIPHRRIAELVPAQSHAQPAFKIMRRTITDRPRSKPQSQAGSVIGEDPDLSDVEPSEAGSIGGRSNATGSGKKHMSIAEREAAYNEARSRIFMKFEEKVKGKDKELSASSSSASLTSGSVTSSAGETSSTGDLDDSVSSPATESEWSGPAVRDKRDGCRSNGSSSKSLRSNPPTYGSNSSRGSRPPSPSFRYPSLYEPSPASTPYDPSHHPMHPPGYANPYVYGYPQPGPPPNYIAPYPYYTPYPYPLPQVPMHAGDSGIPSTQPDVFTPQQHTPHPGVFVAYGGWDCPPQHPQLPPLPPTQQPPHQSPGTPIAPPASQYPPFPSVPSYGAYPVPAFYHLPPPLTHFPSSPGPQNHPHGSPEYNGGHGTHNGFSPGRPYPGVAGQQSPTMTNKPRGAPPARSAWSYGPGVGMGGFGVANVSTRSNSCGEVVGPRLSSAIRRPGNGHSNTVNRAPAGDEASSTASSSTSSSSRRTFTSGSSQHPLPARPDWAVGLKPQPTLHPTHNRHHDHAMNSRTMSPARNGQRGQHVSPALQATDFPPLNPVSPGERRAPPVAGVWNNTSSTRSILIGSQGGALANHLSNGRNATMGPPSNGKLEDSEGAWKPGIMNSKSPVPQDRSDKDKERVRGDMVASVILADKVGLLSIDDKDSTVNGAKPVAPLALST